MTSHVSLLLGWLPTINQKGFFVATEQRATIWAPSQNYCGD